MDTPEKKAELTELLKRWAAGDEAAAENIFPLVYEELRRMASAIFRRERADHTLQTTAVVHEAYLRLMKGRPAEVEDRAHFFGLMARVMRQVLVDYARSHNRAKRGGGAFKVSYEDVAGVQAEPAPDILALDEALTRFASIDPDKARVVELRYFGGLTIEETAACLETSPATVVRWWRLARAWLYRELSSQAPDDEPADT